MGGQELVGAAYQEHRLQVHRSDAPPCAQALPLGCLRRDFLQEDRRRAQDLVRPHQGHWTLPNEHRGSLQPEVQDEGPLRLRERTVLQRRDLLRLRGAQQQAHTFFKQLYAIQVPVSKKDFEWAANWLVQHIINTDFDYKSKLNTYIHEVPRPYVWNTNFEVFYERLDNEHKLLFDAIRHVVDKPDDAGLYDALKTMMADHFVYEQAEFLKIPNFEEWAQDHIAKHDAFMEQLTTHSVPLDCDFVNFVENWFVQHVMNTDFAYRGKVVHDIPAPYIWDESFMTFYKRIDDEHKVLFDCI